jgi:hypothetical protein
MNVKENAMPSVPTPRPLNTPEELHAIRAAVREGKNPLIATDVPRWEDEVGVSRIINRRVLELEPLPTPAQVLGELSMSQQSQDSGGDVARRDSRLPVRPGRPAAGDRRTMLGA